MKTIIEPFKIKTVRANVEMSGAEAVDLPVAEGAVHCLSRYDKAQ